MKLLRSLPTNKGFYNVYALLIKVIRKSKIKAFADATPPAPLPEQKAELYDPTQAANITITLKIEQNSGKENNVIYIEPKR